MLLTNGVHAVCPLAPHFFSLPQSSPSRSKLGSYYQFHVGCSYLSLASSSPSYLQKRHLQEHTQLALCLRERQSKAAGDVPLPIKINGTKTPSVLHEFHLPGSLLSIFSHQAPSWLSYPLRVLDTGQKPSLREGGQGKSGQEAHAHPTHTCLLIHTCRHMCVYMHYKHKHTHTCARAFCTSMHLFSFYLLLVKSLATS